MKNKVLIAIPMYNCEAQVQRVLRELFLEKTLWSDFDIQVLVIDNCSGDNSVGVVSEIINTDCSDFKVILIRNKNNIGLGGSQKQAFRWAMEGGYEFLIVLHGDHQATAKEIERLSSLALMSPDQTAILGSRFSKGSVRTGYSRVRTIGNRGLNVIYSLLCLKNIEDLGSGLNLFRVSDFAMTRVMDYSSDFTFNMDLLLDMVSRRKNFKYCPITWTELDQVSNARNFKVGFKALVSVLRWRCGFKSLSLVSTPLDYEVLIGNSQ